MGVQSQFFFILTQKHQRGYQKTYPNQETAKKSCRMNKKNAILNHFVSYKRVIPGREHKKTNFVVNTTPC